MNKSNKLFQGIEVHRYAPEQSKVHLRNGVEIGYLSDRKYGRRFGGHVPLTFRKCRARWFKPATKWFHHAVVTSHYRDGLEWLNRTQRGTFKDYAELRDAIKAFKKRCNGGDCTFTIKITSKFIANHVDVGDE